MLGKIVVCNWGNMKGKSFEVVTKLKNGNYSCKLADKSNDKYYEYSSNQLDIKKDVSYSELDDDDLGDIITDRQNSGYGR